MYKKELLYSCWGEKTTIINMFEITPIMPEFSPFENNTSLSNLRIEHHRMERDIIESASSESLKSNHGLIHPRYI